MRNRSRELLRTITTFLMVIGMFAGFLSLAAAGGNYILFASLAVPIVLLQLILNFDKP